MAYQQLGDQTVDLLSGPTSPASPSLATTTSINNNTSNDNSANQNRAAAAQRPTSPLRNEVRFNSTNSFANASLVDVGDQSDQRASRAGPSSTTQSGGSVGRAASPGPAIIDPSIFAQQQAPKPTAQMAGSSSGVPPRVQSPSLSGKIGQSTATSGPNRGGGPSAASAATPTGTIPQQLDTLDEPVWHTIRRDLLSIWVKVKMVLFPRNRGDILKDWDLWGPLLISLSLAVLLSSVAPSDQTAAVFTGIFVLACAGTGVVTINSKLLGGHISFFQSVCVLCYCLFPLSVASFICLFVKIFFARIGIACGAFVWCTYASLGFLSGTETQLQGRKALAVYPIGLFYLSISYVLMVSDSAI